MGDPRDMRNFINAVIDEKAFDKIAAYIDGLKKDKKNVTLIAGGKYDKSVGWFIEPTIAVTKDPKSTTMCEEIFGPVLTISRVPGERMEQDLETGGWHQRLCAYRRRDSARTVERSWRPPMPCATRPATSTSTTSPRARW
jgi:hypothetical protein